MQTVENGTRLGSTRIMTPVEPGVIALRYTDQWSAFDRGASPQLIPGIGAARCACAVKSFQLAAAAGLPTHFVEQVDSETIHVMEFLVPGRKPLSGKAHGAVLPLEWIWRDLVYGSLLGRIRDGKINPCELGFLPDAQIIEGMKLPQTMIECTTKFEPTDRHLSDPEACKLARLGPSRWHIARTIITDAVRATNAAYGAAGFVCPDGKLELGMCNDGAIILVDVFGTQDENRIIHEKTGGIYSKDLIRNWLNEQPWEKELVAAKKLHPHDKSKWPAYPTLPEDLVGHIFRRYADVAYLYADVHV